MRRKVVKTEINGKLILMILITLGIVFALSPTISNYLSFNAGINDKSLENFDNQNLKLSKISGPISIDGNLEWFAFKNDGNCTGEGTYSNPYVIEDLEIVGGGSGSGISIANSDVYFNIENCTISGFSNGISLYYANNGTLIENNCSNNIYGLHTGFSDNNTVLGNIASDNSNSGIFLDNSTNHIVSGNNCSRNTEIGLYIQKCINITLSENYVIDSGWENGWDDTGKNQWDNGAIGNYWSDYPGNDTNDNGIGDTPYAIPGDTGAQDNFPIWDDGPEPVIPGTPGISGYNLFFLFGALSVVAIIISIKLKKFNK